LAFDYSGNRLKIGIEIPILRLEKTNARTADPNDPTRTILAAEQRTDGFEFELAGEILSNWNVFRPSTS
jgi:Outer membrane receptor for monomeric catechols